MFVSILLLLIGCPTSGTLPPSATPTPTPVEPTPSPTPFGPVTIEPAAPCEDPVEGFLRLQPGDRGLDQDNPADDSERSCVWMPGGVVATDLDADGDHDLLFNAPPGFPALWAGGEGFTPVDVDVDLSALQGREPLSQAAVDLDGDGLPEVLLVGEGFAASFRNLGGLTFAPPELLYFDDEYPLACINSLAVGDVDGDGDLDLALPGLDPIPYASWVPTNQLQYPGTADVLLLQEDGAFSVAAELEMTPYPWLSLHALFTDRDDDGDLDLFVGADRSRDGRPGAAFWRNDGFVDGELSLVDDAPDISADHHACVMGAVGYDFDRDGDRDYCFSDLGRRMRCLLNVGGSYAEGADVLGLVADVKSVPGWTPGKHGPWAAWSLEGVDLDNDGYLDIASAAGPPPGPAGVLDSNTLPFEPDVLWQGTSGGFVDRSVEAGYTDTRSHYGMASADLDRDGYRELIIGSFGGPVVLWDNPCGENTWVEIALEGLAGNREGFGAQVTVVAGDLLDVQELHGLRSLGQSPAEVHVGLGTEETIDRLEVRWPDGAVSEAFDLPVNARIVVRHPGLVE